MGDGSGCVTGSGGLWLGSQTRPKYIMIKLPNVFQHGRTVGVNQVRVAIL